MNILVSLNRGYIKQLKIMLFSLSKQHSNADITVYIMHNSLTKQDFSDIEKISSRIKAVSVDIPKDFLSEAQTSSRYPTEMYYRIFAAALLPTSVDKILYLDPDLIIINPINELYDMQLGEKLFAAASHIQTKGGLNIFNRIRLSMPKESSYINSGVMLMNIKRLREVQDPKEVFEFLDKHNKTLMLPDQDILNAVYAKDIVKIDFLKYNLSERCFGLYNMRPKNRNNKITVDWVRKNTSVIHYCGRNKPWKQNYFGEFDSFYHELETEAAMEGII